MKGKSIHVCCGSGGTRGNMSTKMFHSLEKSWKLETFCSQVDWPDTTSKISTFEWLNLKFVCIVCGWSAHHYYEENNCRSNKWLYYMHGHVFETFLWLFIFYLDTFISCLYAFWSESGFGMFGIVKSLANGIDTEALPTPPKNLHHH